MTNGRSLELLDCSDVDMAHGSCDAVRMDSSVARIRWVDTAFRVCRALRTAELSVNRVPASEESQMDLGRSRHLVRGRMACCALQGRCNQTLAHQGHGHDRLLGMLA